MKETPRLQKRRIELERALLDLSGYSITDIQWVIMDDIPGFHNFPTTKLHLEFGFNELCVVYFSDFIADSFLVTYGIYKTKMFLDDSISNVAQTIMDMIEQTRKDEADV